MGHQVPGLDASRQMRIPSPAVGAKKAIAGLPPGVKVVAKNRKALFDYEVVDRVEAGIVLQGTEVKSLRDGKIQLLDAYALISDDEVYLHHAHIPEYSHGSYANHDPVRVRKLLLHRREIDRLQSRVTEKGLTLIPLEVYFKEGRAKLTLGLCRGKAKHDKRAAIKEKDEKRSQDREREY